MRSRIFYTAAIAVIGLISFMEMKGAASIECYTCTDQGDGGCMPDKVANVSCLPDHDMCVETITAIMTSDDSHVVLKKGCGYGYPTTLNKSTFYYGISLHMQLNQCNLSLCNTNLDLKHYQLPPDDDVTQEANDNQCYSCVGTPKAECSPTNAPVRQCYDTYIHCFDGNVTMSIGNDTTIIPVKSCSLRHRCSKHSLTYGCVTVEMRGACCSEGNCNSDLSNKTHLADLPYLVLLNDQNEEVTTTMATTQRLNKTTKMDTTPTNASVAGDGKDSYGNFLSQDREGNAASGLSFSCWLLLILMALS